MALLISFLTCGGIIIPAKWGLEFFSKIWWGPCIKKKSRCFARVVGNFAHEQWDAIFRLRAWLAAVLRIFSATFVTSELYGHLILSGGGGG